MAEWSEDIAALSEQIIVQASELGLTVGTAESCTGGLVSAALTSVAGSSAVVHGGVVSYAVSVKEAVLGVSRDITQTPRVGVVSSECARAMCEGARRVLSCDIAVSTTGIAGPGGAEPGKPVGTVWFGICSPLSTTSELCCFAGDRPSVREQAVEHALSLMVRALEELACA